MDRVHSQSCKKSSLQHMYRVYAGVSSPRNTTHIQYYIWGMAKAYRLLWWIYLRGARFIWWIFYLMMTLATTVMVTIHRILCAQQFVYQIHSIALSFSFPLALTLTCRHIYRFYPPFLIRLWAKCMSMTTTDKYVMPIYIYIFMKTQW